MCYSWNLSLIIEKARQVTHCTILCTIGIPHALGSYLVLGLSVHTMRRNAKSEHTWHRFRVTSVRYVVFMHYLKVKANIFPHIQYRLHCSIHVYTIGIHHVISIGRSWPLRRSSADHFMMMNGNIKLFQHIAVLCCAMSIEENPHRTRH